MTKVHPTAIIENGAELGADIEIGPFCLVGSRARLADGVRLLSHATVTGDTEIGARTVVYAHAALGGGPQYRGDTGAHAKLVIAEDNVIREHVTMNGGSAKGGGLTKVGGNGYFMAYSHVAHDCQIGDNVTFANGVALGGHVIIGDGANIGGLAAVQQYARIGRNAFVGGVTGVPNDVIPYGIVQGDRASLDGLNLIGLRRRGIPRERIHALRSAFRHIFFGGGQLLERTHEAELRWKEYPEVMEVVAFIFGDSKRGICIPKHTRPGEEEENE